MDFYRISEAAKILRVSRTTIYMWLDNKQIKGIQLPNKEWRIPVSEIERIKKGE